MVELYLCLQPALAVLGLENHRIRRHVDPGRGDGQLGGGACHVQF